MRDSLSSSQSPSPAISKPFASAALRASRIRRRAGLSVGVALLALVTTACMGASADEIGDVSTVFKFLVYR